MPCPERRKSSPACQSQWCPSVVAQYFPNTFLFVERKGCEAFRPARAGNESRGHAFGGGVWGWSQSPQQTKTDWLSGWLIVSRSSSRDIQAPFALFVHSKLRFATTAGCCRCEATSLCRRARCPASQNRSLMVCRDLLCGSSSVRRNWYWPVRRQSDLEMTQAIRRLCEPRSFSVGRLGRDVKESGRANRCKNFQIERAQSTFLRGDVCVTAELAFALALWTKPVGPRPIVPTSATKFYSLQTGPGCFSSMKPALSGSAF